MSRKQQNEDELVNHATKHLNLNDIRKFFPTEEIPILANTLSKNYMKIINDELEYIKSAPITRNIKNDVLLLKFLICQLKTKEKNKELWKLFETQEIAITSIIRKIIRSNGYSTDNDSSSSKLRNNHLEIIDDALKNIMKYYNSLPTEQKPNEDELLKIVTIGLRCNDNLMKLFQTEETHITHIIREKIRYYIRTKSFSSSSTLGHNNMQTVENALEKIIKYYNSLPTKQKLHEDELEKIITIALGRTNNFSKLFKIKKTNVASITKRRNRSHGPSSSNVNSNSNKLNVNDLDIFWTKVLQVLQGHIDNGFRKSEQLRYQNGLVDRVIIRLRQEKSANELFKIKIDITDIYKIVSCAASSSSFDVNSNSSVSPQNSLSRRDLKSFVENVTNIVDELANVGFLKKSDPLSEVFQNFLEKSKRDLRNR